MRPRSALLKENAEDMGATMVALVPRMVAERVKTVGDAVRGSVLMVGLNVRLPAKRVSNGMRAT
jgi:hypothetical protein